MHARFRIPVEEVKVCVAANGAVYFSVRGFGCALFILGGDCFEDWNEKAEFKKSF